MNIIHTAAVSPSFILEKETYLFFFNHTDEALFKLDKSVNSLEIHIDNLTEAMEMSVLVNSILSQRKHIENAQMNFQSQIHHMVKTKVWPKIGGALFLLMFFASAAAITLSIRVYCRKLFETTSFERKICCFINLCLRRKSPPSERAPVDISAKDSLSRHQHLQTFNEKIAYQCIPFRQRVASPSPSPSSMECRVVSEKSSPLPRKLYHYVRSDRNSIESLSNTT